MLKDTTLRRADFLLQPSLPCKQGLTSCPQAFYVSSVLDATMVLQRLAVAWVSLTELHAVLESQTEQTKRNDLISQLRNLTVTQY